MVAFAAETKTHRTMTACMMGEDRVSGWLNWLIILTVAAVVAITLWHLLAMLRRRIDRLAASASLGHAPTRPGHWYPAHRA